MNRIKVLRLKTKHRNLKRDAGRRKDRKLKSEARARKKFSAQPNDNTMQVKQFLADEEPALVPETPHG